MKYMTFNSSCSYAGIANMLAQYGVDVEDRDIALGMGLPYLFAKEDGTYLAGPMLQSARWFNLYLHKIGFTMKEELTAKEEVPERLRAEHCAMLGLRISPQSKHAVIYIGSGSRGNNTLGSEAMDCAEDRYVFLNNKWQHSDEPELLDCSRQELLDRLDESVMIATIAPITERSYPDPEHTKQTRFQQSCEVLKELKQDIQTFCEIEQSPAAIRMSMNTMFRAILLDAVTMLELAENISLADTLRTIQRQFLMAVRTGNAVVLAEKMSVPVLLEAMDQYIDWIRETTET